MTWTAVINVVGLLLASLAVAETFRREPMWLRPEKGPSPRQRRWLGIGLIFVTTSGLIAELNRAGETELRLLTPVSAVLGVVAILVGIGRRPTDEELERRSRLLDRR